MLYLKLTSDDRGRSAPNPRGETLIAKRRILAIVFAVALILPGSSRALEREWSRVDLNNSEYDDRYYMDLGSFVVKETEVIFWGRDVFPGGFNSVQRISIECARGRYKVHERHFYDKEGRFVEEDDSSTAWLPTKAASFYGYLEPLVCADNKPKSFGYLTSIGAMIYNVRVLRGYNE